MKQDTFSIAKSTEQLLQLTLPELLPPGDENSKIINTLQSTIYLQSDFIPYKIRFYTHIDLT